MKLFYSGQRYGWVNTCEAMELYFNQRIEGFIQEELDDFNMKTTPGGETLEYKTDKWFRMTNVINKHRS